MRFSMGVGVGQVQISGERGHRPPTSVGVTKTSDYSVMWCQNIGSMFFHFVISLLIHIMIILTEEVV